VAGNVGEITEERKSRWRGRQRLRNVESLAAHNVYDRLTSMHTVSSSCRMVQSSPVSDNSLSTCTRSHSDLAVSVELWSYCQKTCSIFHDSKQEKTSKPYKLSNTNRYTRCICRTGCRQRIAIETPDHTILYCTSDTEIWNASDETSHTRQIVTTR